MSESNNNTTARTMGFSLCTMGFITFIVFLILKLTNVVDWSWFWIWFPLWVPIAASAAVGLICLLVLCIIVKVQERNQ